MLLEKIPLAGIARVTSVSPTWLQEYVNAKYDKVYRGNQVSPKQSGKLIIECDELWSFVENKRNKQWIWLALDNKTSEIVEFYLGSRSREGALGLWKSLPPVYRQCAICYTDCWESYDKVIPVYRHKAVEKESGKTNHIEKFNNTLRQRVSRLVKKNFVFF